MFPFFFSVNLSNLFQNSDSLSLSIFQTKRAEREDSFCARKEEKDFFVLNNLIEKTRSHPKSISLFFFF